MRELRLCVATLSHLDRRYQLFLFFLCGYGYLIDLMFAQAFGLILAPLQQELNISSEFWWCLDPLGGD